MKEQRGEMNLLLATHPTSDRCNKREQNVGFFISVISNNFAGHKSILWVKKDVAWHEIHWCTCDGNHNNQQGIKKNVNFKTKHNANDEKAKRQA